MDKKTLATCLAFLALCAVSLSAADIELSTSVSTFALDEGGSFEPFEPGFGFGVSVTDRILDHLDATISFDRDPANGNLLSARASYRTSFLVISAGPSFGVLNSSSDDDAISNLLQPGLGIGFKVILPGVVVAAVDSDFAFPPATNNAGQVYLQRGEISAGFYLPNVLCTLKARQRSDVETLAAGATILRSTTDYGLYTEAFRKGSPFRISLDFVYRIVEYRNDALPLADRSYGNLVLGCGVTWAPKDDLSFFLSGNGALYTFSLDDSASDVESFLFDVKLGVRFATKSLGATN